MKKIALLCALLTSIFGACTTPTNPPEPSASTAANAGTSAFEESAYDYLLKLLEIPRGSDNEKEVSDYLMAFAGEHELEAVQDETLNVFIKKAGSEGREDEPSVILQAHMDMVCEKNSDVDHDFLKDPIKPIVDGDWLTADGTTLGADNGVGVAMILAVLADKTLSHPPIEAVITTREETDMGGAEAFDTSLLKGKRFINVDSEEEWAFTVSCASTNDITYTIPIETETVPQGYAAYTLMVVGLQGGHSGGDIDKGRANANIILGGLLAELSTINCQLSTIEGGSKRNAIPRESNVTLLFPENNLDSVKSAVEKAEADFKAEYPNDSEIKITLEKTETPDTMMTPETVKMIIDAITLVPTGVQSMSEHIEGLVQTSNNLGVITTEGNAVTLINMMRSSNLEEQNALLKEMEKLAGELGIGYELGGQSPLWEYREDSPLRDEMAEVYKDVFGKEAQIIAIHAGLECAMFARSMPDCDFISIGPDIFDVHSPDEKMSIPSFNKMCGFLVKLLEQI